MTPRTFPNGSTTDAVTKRGPHSTGPSCTCAPRDSSRLELDRMSSTCRRRAHPPASGPETPRSPGRRCRARAGSPRRGTPRMRLRGQSRRANTTPHRGPPRTRPLAARNVGGEELDCAVLRSRYSFAEAPPPASSDAPSPAVVDLLKHALTKLCHAVTAPAVPRTQYQRLPVPQHHRCAVPYLRTGRLLAR